MQATQMVKSAPTTRYVAVLSGKHRGKEGLVSRRIANHWADGKVLLVTTEYGETFWVAEGITRDIEVPEPVSEKVTEPQQPIAAESALRELVLDLSRAMAKLTK